MSLQDCILNFKTLCFSSVIVLAVSFMITNFCCFSSSSKEHTVNISVKLSLYLPLCQEKLWGEKEKKKVTCDLTETKQVWLPKGVWVIFSEHILSFSETYMLNEIIKYCCNSSIPPRSDTNHCYYKIFWDHMMESPAGK